jgi:cytochrome P450
MTQRDTTFAVDEEFLRTFDYESPEYSEDPHSVLRAVRTASPIVRSDLYGGYWFVTTYAEGYRVLADPKTFSSSVTLVPPPEEPFDLIPVTVDPPDHTAYRKLMTPLFSPGEVARLEPAIRARARALIATYLSAGAGDFVAEVAIPLPSTVFLELLGLPQSDLPRLLQWKEAILRGRVAADDDVRNHALQVEIPGFLEYASTIVADRRAAPPTGAPDVLTGLVSGTINIDGGRPMTDAEIVSAVALLVVAGLDTVTNALAFSMETLAKRPDLRQHLAENPELIPTAVEEFLRFWSTVTTSRYTTTDVEIAGQLIKAGDMVSISTPAAGRDPAQYEDPEEIRFDRAVNRHLAFGAGPHRCLGSHLARLEMKIALEEVMTMMPQFVIASCAEPTHVFGHMMECTNLKLTIQP